VGAVLASVGALEIRLRKSGAGVGRDNADARGMLGMFLELTVDSGRLGPTGGRIESPQIQVDALAQQAIEGTQCHGME